MNDMSLVFKWDFDGLSVFLMQGLGKSIIRWQRIAGEDSKKLALEVDDFKIRCRP